MIVVDIAQAESLLLADSDWAAQSLTSL